MSFADVRVLNKLNDELGPSFSLQPFLLCSLPIPTEEISVDLFIQDAASYMLFLA
jgi:hypothetical protein